MTAWLSGYVQKFHQSDRGKIVIKVFPLIHLNHMDSYLEILRYLLHCANDCMGIKDKNCNTSLGYR